MLTDYGALDVLGTCMYIPPSMKFTSFVKTIDSLSNIQIGIKGERNPLGVSHPGGDIIILKESGEIDPSIPTHFPYSFCAPSIVTVNKEDIKELTIDVERRPGDTAPWPGISQVCYQ